MTETNTLPDELGTAVRVGNFDNKAPEWHDLRKTGIGGSDVSSIVGVNPWTSPFTLWAKKTGRIDDSFVPSEAAEWGTRLESVILDKFVEDNPELTVYRDVGTWRNVERSFQLANPDGIYKNAAGDYGIIEIKTSRFEDDWTDGVPAYYRTQVQWYSQTFGFTGTIYVVALFSGSKYKVYEVEPDDFEQASNLAAVESFLPYIEKDEQPDYDGALSTLNTIRELHPDIDPEAEVELGELYFLYSVAMNDEKQATAHSNEMKSRVLDALGKAKRGTFNGQVVVTRQSRSGGAPYLVNKKG
jgi:putative phage-type endonuclease